MRDRRYKKTECKILSVFFGEIGKEISMQNLAEKAGIARSTIYLHHHSLWQIIPDCEKDILEEYFEKIKRKLKDGTYIRKFYLDTLVFILKNREFFEAFLKFNNREVVIKMLSRLKEELREPEKVFGIYISEVTEVIFEWGHRGFPEGELEKVLADIMYLTNTMKERLGPLA